MKNENFDNLLFCNNYINLLNIKNKNKLDKYLIFISKCQLNLIIKCIQILIDGIFNAVQKHQMINNAGICPYMNAIIPLFLILLQENQSIYTIK